MFSSLLWKPTLNSNNCNKRPVLRGRLLVLLLLASELSLEFHEQKVGVGNKANTNQSYFSTLVKSSLLSSNFPMPKIFFLDRISLCNVRLGRLCTESRSEETAVSCLLECIYTIWCMDGQVRLVQILGDQ